MEMTFPLARSEGFENSSAGSGVRIPALTLESSIVFVLVDLGSLFTKQECHHTIQRDAKPYQVWQGYQVSNLLSTPTCQLLRQSLL